MSFVAVLLAAIGILISGYILLNSRQRSNMAKKDNMYDVSSIPNSGFDKELSELFTTLWALDDNRCIPGSDYDLDLQWFVTGTNMNLPDKAGGNFFKFLDEKNVFSRPTYSAFRGLVDNYQTSTDVMEEISPQEVWENWHFLDLVCHTHVMCEAHDFLVKKGKADPEIHAFKQTLYDMWFKIYKRTKEDNVANSCGFEHVFVGETRDHEVIGFHNWIQFYLQENAGNINYRGYFRRGTTEEMEKSPHLVTLQFTWQKFSGKPIGSMFVGPSPEFEFALYTVMFLMGKQKALVRIKNYEVELTCYRLGRGIGSAYPVSKSD